MPDDKLLRFTIVPTATGTWLWRTIERDGAVRAQGIAPSKKLAAALVIRDIVAARLDRPEHIAAPLPAKAA
ncbi:hypothetical protein [Caulobacter sp. X]|uniref:hypothetical protein n=1 Tax=Caulobacter sp. X TaxID=2048901 RepID=UPI000C14B26F|nr:hypothetical protein [Caulobacter sp. X]PIC01091.1 hypothetical protein CSW60_06015 [Caulobacter sp. X]